MFILEANYAVVWKVASEPRSMMHKQVMTQAEWDEKQAAALAGHVVILECWDITRGRCVSN